MSYLRNTLTSAIVGWLPSDSAEYYALTAQRQAGTTIGLWEEVAYEQAFGSLTGAAAGTALAAVFPASTILQTLTQLIGLAPVTGRLLAATVTPAASIAGAASPASRTWKVSNLGPGGEVADLAQLALLAGVNPVADTPSTLTAVDDAVTALEVNAGDVLQFSSTPVGGTGLVDPGGIVAVTITPAL